MSESNKRDRDSLNREVGVTAQTGRDNSILHTIKLMTGASLEKVNEMRMGEITGENAVNERGAAQTVLTNSFTELYGQMLKLLSSNESGEMKGMLAKVLDLPIQKPSDGDGMMAVTLVNNPDEILKKMDAGGAKPLDNAVKPADVADVKNFVADMVYSDDMLFMELSENVNAGAKMREALAAPGRAAALAEIIKDPDVLNSAVAPTVADVVKGGMQKFIEILDAAFKAANNGESLADAAKKEGFAERLAAFIADKSKLSDDELARLPARRRLPQTAPRPRRRSRRSTGRATSRSTPATAWRRSFRNCRNSDWNCRRRSTVSSNR